MKNISKTRSYHKISMKHPSKPAGPISVESLSQVQAYVIICTIRVRTSQKICQRTLSSHYLRVTISIRKYLCDRFQNMAPHKALCDILHTCALAWHTRCSGLPIEVSGTNVTKCLSVSCKGFSPFDDLLPCADSLGLKSWSPRPTIVGHGVRACFHSDWL
jgi:hypothetical protein